MTGRPVIGLLLALLVESAHWTKLRWDFDDDACSRAWQMTTVITAIAAVLIYMEGNLYNALPNLLTWLPALLLPMQFVQSFSFADSIPLNTFSFLARQRRERNLRLGLTESIVHIHFGNIYFAATIVSCALGTRASGQDSLFFLPGIIVLTGWMLLSSSQSRRLSLVFALVVAGLVALFGQKGMEDLRDRFTSSAPSQTRFNPNNNLTMIGVEGEIVQSPDIVWRIKPVDRAPAPRLLRTASYNFYRNGIWETRSPINKEFRDLDSRLYEGNPYFLLQTEATEREQLRAVRKTLPRFKLRGAAFAETPLALPSDTSSIVDLEVDSIERNGFGTVRVFPRLSVIEGTVLWRGEASTDNPPLGRLDISDPADSELAGLDTVLDELKLHELETLDDKLNTLRAWFQKEFKYSRTLSIKKGGAETPLTRFLLETRSGHCEYFATATALLLRRVGVPVRYAVGYAVAESDPGRKEFVIRGTHGHAWCRVWDQAKQSWIDVDTTPSSWMPMVEKYNTRTQRFNDMIRRWREDFFLWRNRPANRLGATVIMGLIALGVVAFVARRLWKSKRRLDAKGWIDGYQGTRARTPLNQLETAARKHLGPRPTGQPFALWLTGLRPHLPHPADLDEAIALHQQLRYDPAPQEPTRLDRLAELARNLESALKRK